MEPIQAVLAIIALVGAGKWNEAGPMILRLIASLWEALSPAELAAVMVSPGFASSAGKRSDQLCDELRAALGPPEGRQAIDIKELAKLILPILFTLAELMFRKIRGQE